MTTDYRFAEEGENETEQPDGDSADGSADDTGQSPSEGSDEGQSEPQGPSEEDRSSADAPDSDSGGGDGAGGGSGSADGGGGGTATPPPTSPSDDKRKREWQKKKAAAKAAKKAATKVVRKTPVKVVRAVTRARPQPKRNVQQRRRGRFGEILEEQAGFGLDSYKEDVDAINAYFIRTPAKNADASSVAVEWAVFRQKYDNAGWFNQRFSQNLWNEARGLRDKYNAANGDKLPPDMVKTSLKAEDLGQAQPLGGMLGTLPSDLADKGVVAIWTHLPLAGKVVVGGIAGLMTYKLVK